MALPAPNPAVSQDVTSAPVDQPVGEVEPDVEHHVTDRSSSSESPDETRKYSFFLILAQHSSADQPVNLDVGFNQTPSPNVSAPPITV